MKKSMLFLFPLTVLMIAGCNLVDSSSEASSLSSSGTTLINGGSVTTNVTPTTVTTIPTASTSASEPDWEPPVDLGDFSILRDGEAAGFTISGSTITITEAGAYTLTGKLEGNIVINAKDQEVELDLEGVEISCSDYAPIFAIKADELKIKSKKNTSNIINDNRATKTVDSDDQGEGAIAAKCDIHFVGTGTLIVTGNYNNGIHTSKDLKIKNVQLKVYGYQHALRGGNGIEIVNEKTFIHAIAKTGDGLKSNDAGVTSKGRQKGTIDIKGGTLLIHAYNDGIDAAYDVLVSSGLADEDDESSNIIEPSISIYTEKFATLTKVGPGWNDSGNSNKSSTTAKGIKAANEISVSGGEIYIKAYDDGLHSNNAALTDSDDVETGQTGAGNINITGGNITIDCTDDGMHADNKLAISGGTVNVTNSYEGLEGHEIVISGGHTKVVGSDDGVNAGGDDNPSITVAGGFLEVEVSPSGDTDGIDSNGTYTQTGGVVITKGPNSQNSSALDHEGTATINGGTIIVLGAIEGQNAYEATRWGGGGGPGGPGGGGSSNVTIGSNMTKYTLSLHSSGSHQITVNGVTYEFTNSKAYGKTTCYSDSPVTGS